MIDQSAYCLSPTLSPSLQKNLRGYKFGDFTLHLELSPIEVRRDLEDYIQYMDECQYKVVRTSPDKIDIVLWLVPGSRIAFTLLKHKTMQIALRKGDVICRTSSQQSKIPICEPCLMRNSFELENKGSDLVKLACELK